MRGCLLMTQSGHQFAFALPLSVHLSRALRSPSKSSGGGNETARVH